MLHSSVYGIYFLFGGKQVRWPTYLWFWTEIGKYGGGTSPPQGKMDPSSMFHFLRVWGCPWEIIFGRAGSVKAEDRAGRENFREILQWSSWSRPQAQCGEDSRGELLQPFTRNSWRSAEWPGRGAGQCGTSHCLWPNDWFLASPLSDLPSSYPVCLFPSHHQPNSLSHSVESGGQGSGLWTVPHTVGRNSSYGFSPKVSHVDRQQNRLF